MCEWCEWIHDANEYATNECCNECMMQALIAQEDRVNNLFHLLAAQDVGIQVWLNTGNKQIEGWFMNNILIIIFQYSCTHVYFYQLNWMHCLCALNLVSILTLSSACVYLSVSSLVPFPCRAFVLTWRVCRYVDFLPQHRVATVLTAMLEGEEVDSSNPSLSHPRTVSPQMFLITILSTCTFCCPD